MQVWSALDFKPIKTLAGHESKLSGVDVAAGESFEHNLTLHKIQPCVLFCIPPADLHVLVWGFGGWMADGTYIATVSHDRTIKLWSHFNE